MLPSLEISQLICCANQLTGFYIRAALALNGLMLGLLSKFTFSRLKVEMLELLSNFQRHKGNCYVKLTMLLLLPVSALNAMYTITLCQKQLWRNLASVNLKLKKLNYLLKNQPKFFVLAFLTLQVAQKVV